MGKMKSGNIQAIFFDLDGTLVDTIGDIARAMNRVLKEYGYPEHPAEEYKNLVGYGLRITARNALPKDARDEKTVRKAGELLIRYYREHPVDTTLPYEGVPEMLADLSTAGVKTAVLSNKAHDLVERVVDQVLKGYDFTALRGATNGYPLKPDPSSAIALAESLNVNVRNILFVGDSEVDIKTAHAAGMASGGVSWGFRKTAVLENAGADIIFREPKDIARFVDHNR